jgi:hypothetical protein
MLPIEIKDLVRSQIQDVIDLRLLRGSTPWSLAGTDGSRREINVERRERLVSRINAAVRPAGWSAEIAMIRSVAGRTNKIELVLVGPSGESEVWTW